MVQKIMQYMWYIIVVELYHTIDSEECTELSFLVQNLFIILSFHYSFLLLEVAQ
jgi:hypothetical protein